MMKQKLHKSKHTLDILWALSYAFYWQIEEDSLFHLSAARLVYVSSVVT